MSKPILDVRHLALLSAIEDAGSLNAAARRLHLSPSALSQQLRELEDRLGGPMFHRQWRRLVPTKAGRHLTEKARGLLRDWMLAEAEARRLLDGARSTIRVATACFQSYQWMPAVLRRFAETWPDVEVTVVPEAGNVPSDHLLERKLDLALVVSEMKLGPKIRRTPLFEDELVALVSRAHPWFRRRMVEVHELADQHLWIDENALEPSSLLGRALARAGNITPQKVSYVPMSGIVPLEMARNDLGITIMPRWSVADHIRREELAAVRIGPRGLWHVWAAATREEEAEPALAAFLALLATHHPLAASARVRNDRSSRSPKRGEAQRVQRARARRLVDENEDEERRRTLIP